MCTPVVCVAFVGDRRTAGFYLRSSPRATQNGMG